MSHVTRVNQLCHTYSEITMYITSQMRATCRNSMRDMPRSKNRCPRNITRNNTRNRTRNTHMHATCQFPCETCTVHNMWCAPRTQCVAVCCSVLQCVAV